VATQLQNPSIADIAQEKEQSLESIENGDDIRKEGEGEEGVHNLEDPGESCQREKFDVNPYVNRLLLILLRMRCIADPVYSDNEEN
jgi:hypothetical protein